MLPPALFTEAGARSPQEAALTASWPAVLGCDERAAGAAKAAQGAAAAAFGCADARKAVVTCHLSEVVADFPSKRLRLWPNLDHGRDGLKGAQPSRFRLLNPVVYVFSHIFFLRSIDILFIDNEKEACSETSQCHIGKIMFL